MDINKVVSARRVKDDALDAYRRSIVDAYRSGHSAYAIAKALGVGIRSVFDVLDRQGIERR